MINQSNNQYFVGNNTSEITNWRYYMPAKYNITNEEIQEFYRLRVQKKMSYTAIGKKFNISAQTVQRRLEDFTKDSKVDLSINYNYDKYYFYDINTPEKAYWLDFINSKSISLYRKYKDAKISILHEVNQKQKALLPF